VIILYFSRITNYVKENLFECILFLLLIISVSLITYYRFKVQLEIGPVWDAYDFLANSAEFAGKSINYTDPMRPPLLSFFTSIFFRYDGLYEGAIFIVDGILFTLGALGLYFLFKFRFEPIYSFIGVLMYVTSPLILSLICGGWSDVSSCSFLILGIYFLILSVKKDSRFFYLTFPLFMMAFLSRYASALIIFPILLYLLIELKNIKRYQNVLVGALISFLVLLPVLIFFQLKFGNFLYPFIDSFGTSKGSDVTLWFAYNPDKLFFFKNMPYYMGSTAIAVFFISLLGCAVILLRKSI
jgi:4-amino-4-deoxy-L-arabinose transferase and related glycosyltransferases of PMT family